MDEEFDKLIEKYKPEKVKKFKQALYIDLFAGGSELAGPDTAYGVCRALCVSFIVRSWSRELDDAFWQSYDPHFDANKIAEFKARSYYFGTAVGGNFFTSFNDRVLRHSDRDRFDRII